jgi:hypothetical protein
METIRILTPPREAFNKNRRVSDLIGKQIEHFKHVESKLPAEMRLGIPQHAVVTEDDAARYIAAMTRLLRGAPAAANAPIPISDARQPIASVAPQGLSLAAAADTAAQPARPPVAKKPSVKTAKKSSRSKGKK